MGWWLIALLIALPFIIYGVFVAGTLRYTYKYLFISLPYVRAKKKPPAAVRVLAIFSALLVLLGVALLLYFAVVGGPTQGRGHHIFENNHNLYMDMQVGLLLLFAGALLSLLVRLLVTRASRRNVLVVGAIIVVVLTSTVIVMQLNYRRSAKLAKTYDDRTMQRLNALPPILLPDRVISRSYASGNAPMLTYAGSGRNAYDVTLYDDKYVQIVGTQAADVSSYFNPTANACDIQGVASGHPALQSGTCNVIAQIHGGTLYTSTQPATSNRSIGAYVKDDAVYYITTGATQQDLIDVVYQLQQIPNNKASQYIQVRL